MVVVLPADAAPRAVETLAAAGIEAAVVGEVVPAGTVDGRRYVEGPLEAVA
jgi:hydrogenase maturation factor